jgi:glycosidase
VSHASETTQPDWIRDAVFYQVFVDRFADGRPDVDPEGVLPWGSEPSRAGFTGGDLRGIEQHLDHVVDLGANALYLTPIFEADTNHRYDTADYGRIDHRLGDLADFRSLLRAAHERGVRVVLDGVFNHTGEGHWAFRHVYAHGARSPYVNWYSIESLPLRRDPVPNYATFAGCPYLPKLNHHNPEVREHLFEVARRWLAEGIDGWRLDVPFEVNDEFWREFRRVVRGAAPGAYLVGEVWELATPWLQGDIFDGTMNYPWRTAVLRFAAGQTDATGLAEELATVGEATPAWARPGMLNLLGSHDTERLSHQLAADPFATQVAVALQMTSEGAPMVYYGDEVGVIGGADPANRACMPWDEGCWDLDLLGWHRTLIRLRREHAALRGPDDEFVGAPAGLLVRRRGSDRDGVTLVVNSTERAVELSDGVLEGAGHDLISGLDLASTPTGRIVPPRSIALVTS